MDLKFEFRNEEQRKFCWSRARNNCFSGGFGNGKTYAACMRLFLCLANYSKYRVAVCRQTVADLRKTTKATFLKICPPEFIDNDNRETGITTLKNGSEILWMHLDSFDEQSLRGLEINSAFIDQAEEVIEEIYLILDSRVGRWDQAQVPEKLLSTNPDWPLDKRGRPRVPNFIDITCNPDTEFHWIWRRFHLNSFERRPNHFYIEAPTDEALNDPDTIEEMKSRDPEWVAKYFKGIWGVSSAQIHRVLPETIIEYSSDLLEMIRTKSALYRSLDHGDTGVSCCLWCAAYRGVYIFYREYYTPNTLISRHRVNITALSEDEEYCGNFADPDIFKKRGQKDGGFWMVADEYLTNDIDAPSLSWTKADNNEFATRNRLNELFKPSKKYVHPLTGACPAPGIYFVKRSPEWPNGCYYSIIQTQAQRKLYLGSENGKPLYADDRDQKVADHAYDPVRYMIAMHGSAPKEFKKRPPLMSFARYNMLLNNRYMSYVVAASSSGYGHDI